MASAQQGGDATIKFVYGTFIALTGLGYGVFLTIFPATLADAYGFANFGWVPSLPCAPW